ncbi:non-ribosomal peptide synthase/polyketide synthase [Speluncibacter jeojiensis]|uniref:Non-ribosomal peptide synthase/polyketide synthase n=1 Tax=Speluncibacter jeojiensis TaxID=2710754 RepID=A0A9X4M2E7_9ACTN|nr:non-ribosomal peptide synthase/polyketide synthase [Corynebacteriales bacterium D3-21]
MATVEAGGHPSEPAGSFPLSSAQVGMWFAQRVRDDVPITISQYVEIRGAFDFELLTRVGRVAALEFGSAVLRIVEIDGMPRQFVDPDLLDDSVVHDLGDEPDPERAAREWMRRESARPLDLLTDRLVYTAMLRLADDHHYWYARIHHIALDGLGAMNFMSRTAELYTAAWRGVEPEPCRALSPDEIAATESTYRSSTRLQRDRAYWAEQVDGLPPAISLARRAPAPIAARPLVCSAELPAGAAAHFDSAVERVGSSAAPLMVAGFAAYLARMTGSEDVVVSLPVTARTTVALRHSGGMVSNVVPLRLRVAPDATVGSLIKQAQIALVGALRHQRYRHEDIRRDMSADSGRLGFFGPAVNIMMFNNQIRLGELDCRFHVLSTGPIEDLAVNLYPAVSGTRTHIDFEANPNRYDKAELREHHTRFLRLFEQFLAAGEQDLVGELDMLTADERAALIPARGPAGGSTRTLPQLLADAAAEHGAAVAVRGAAGELTYRELDERSNRLARVLIAQGAGPETVVAVAMSRSLASLTAIWAVAKTGAAFVPVDPDYPTARVEHMLADSGALCGLTVESTRPALPGDVRWLAVDSGEVAAQVHAQRPDPVTDVERRRRIRLDHPAYLIYTSGSTGRPKGVTVTHRGLENFAVEQRERYRVDGQARVLHVASPSFDASVLEYLLAFANGATLVVAPPGVYGGDGLHRLIADERITHAFVTPSVLASVNPDGLGSLTHLVAGGEAVPAELVERWAPGRSLFNGYGPTETTIMTTISAPLTDPAELTIGAPIRGSSAVVLDARLRPVPVGAPGELYVSGLGLARGYLARPGLTAERFVADPWGSAGARMYRTGDVVRWTRQPGTGPDGLGGIEYSLDYLGRSDHQVKLRGLRIELGEIDAALTAHPAVDFAATVVHVPEADATDRTPGAPNPDTAVLVSYLLPVPGRVLDHAELRIHLSAELPPHMVPVHLVELDAIPLTPVGKLDRAALPAPEPAVVAESVAPRTEGEQLLAGIVGSIVGAPAVGVHDSFFALGGNSLSATQLASRASAAFGADLTVRDVFDHPTVAGLLTRAEELQASGQARRPRLTDGPRPPHVPLSPAQQRLWFLSRFDPESAVNNIPFALRLSGPVDVDALEGALGDVIERHEALRTVYPDSELGPHQVVVDVDRESVDLSPNPATARELPELLGAFAADGFDLTEQVPVRARLFRLDRHEWVLAIIVHHVSADGWSMAPLARDLMLAYTSRTEGREPEFAPLPVQYADYALWQRELLGAEDDPDSTAARQLAHWTRTLTGLPDQLELPTDRPRPKQASFAGRRVVTEIGVATHRRVEQVAREHDATPFMLVHAAFAILLSRLGAGDDIALGTPVAGRGERELDDLVGMFVNTLVLRTAVPAADTVADMIARCRNVDLDAFANADVPFERLVEVLNPARSATRHPLFQVMLAYQNLRGATVELPGLTVQAAEIDVALAKFDLQLTVLERRGDDGEPAGLQAEFTYAADLFDDDTVHAMARRFELLLEAVLDAPQTAVGDLPVLTVAERTRILTDWNATDVAVPAELVLDRFDRHARSMPDAVALVGVGAGADDVTMTYGQFDAAVSRLARRLIAEGVGPEVRVALLMRRSVELMVAMYAVIRAGGAYVPIDPDNPVERTGYVVESAHLLCALVVGRDGADLTGLGQVPVLDLDRLDLSGYPATPVTDDERRAPLRPDHSAYVIYTSGSTGRPKGVEVTHAAAVNLLRWMQLDLPITADDRVVFKAPATFDVSVWECFAVLGVGGRLIVLDHEGHRDPQRLQQVVTEQQATICEFVPSMLDLFLSTPGLGLPDCLHMVYVGGEAISAATAERVTALGLRLGNFYGPTEAAVTTTYHEIEPGPVPPVVPIGRPVWNTRAYVLDERLHPVPVGVPGELYLAGVQLARGYVGRADLTADRFVADAFSGDGERMYRTGDLVRWNDAGQIEYLDRTDFQVKLRGLRIELGEIEAVLHDHPAVDQAVVLVREDQPGQARLVAYLTRAEPGAELDPAVIRADLTGQLPGYMVPTVFVPLTALPVTPTGKLDRRALPVPDAAPVAYRAPHTPSERVVAAVLEDVLGAGRIGLDDDFFALGGNSLIATRVVARVGAELGVSVPVRLLFEAPDVVGFAALVDQADPSEVRPPLHPRQRPERVPLSAAQHRIWFLNRFDPASPAYNLPVAVRFHGDLDAAALRAALADVLQRHEALRTVYPEGPEGPHQLVLDAAAVIDGVALEPTPVPAAELTAAALQLAGQGFDVTVDPPVRARLFRISRREHVLAIVLHHIAGDGWSMGPLAADVMRAYTARRDGRDPGFAPLPVQYADYALWQRELLGDEQDPASAGARQLRHWTHTLAGLPDEIGLPTDRPRPAQPSYRGAHVDFPVPADLHNGMRVFGTDRQASVFMVAHAALAVLLRRHVQGDDIAVGTAVSGRGEAALDELIGMFVGTLVLRNHIDLGDGFDAVLAQVRAGDLAAFAHADLPFERIVEVLDPPRRDGRHPLFQVALSFDDAVATEFELPGVRTVVEPLDPQVAKFDLQLTLMPAADGGLTGRFDYAVDLFDESTVAALADRFVRLLTAALGEPGRPVGELPLLSPAELAALTPKPAAQPQRTLAELLGEAAARHPQRPAVIAQRTLTYRELDERSNRLARELIAKGLGPGSRVALALPRSTAYLIALWAVAKSGAAYVPVDPGLPADRITHMVTDSGAGLGLAHGALHDRLPACLDWIDPDDAEANAASQDATPITDADRVAALRMDDYAYLIYTSGSTGVPKGVALTHAGLAALMAEQRAWFGADGDSRVLLGVSPSFDASLFEVLVAVGSGAALVVSPAGVVGGDELAAVVSEGRVTHAVITPAVLATLDPSDHELLRTIVVIGEKCPPEVVDRWAPGRRLLNGYGPTETTIWATCSEPMAAGEPVTIGRPIAGIGAAVLDRRLRPVPAGVAGELYLTGDALAAGYLRRPALTAERFVAGPDGARMYRSGDLARWVRSDEHGYRLEYLGRTDFQVKVRGLRIELGEIDAALGAHPGIAYAATVGHDDETGQTRLVAYVTAVEDARLDGDELRGFLARTLPGYMVPSLIVPLERMPLSPAGKIDRKALPRPVFGSVRPEYRPPQTPAEAVVARVFAEVSGAERVGLADNFFDLGGNSLTATGVVSRVGAELSRRIPVRLLFDHPVVADFAAAAADAEPADRPALIARPRPQRLPLSPAQQRMWLLSRLEPAVYNIPLVVRLTGELDVAALAAALTDLVDRHESLRTVFPADEQGPHQVVLPAADHGVALASVTDGDLAAVPAELVAAEFDLTAAPPLRAHLLRSTTEPDEYLLVLVLHHIAGDALSLAPLSRDLMAAYTARTRRQAPQWSPLPIQYADYALWQRDLLGDDTDPQSLAGAQTRYWQAALAGLPACLDLPTDRPRLPVASLRGAGLSFELDAAVHQGMERLAREHGATVFMVAHAVLGVLLQRLTGSPDVVVGTPVAGRGEPGLEHLVGMFVGTVVLRAQVDPSATFADVLGEVRRADLDAFAHADVPFERLVEVLAPVRTTAHHPLFQVMLSFQNLDAGELELPDLRVRMVDAPLPVAKFDLQLGLAERRGADGAAAGIGAEFSYATDLFDAVTVQGFADGYRRILTEVLAATDTPVGDLAGISATELGRVLDAGTGPDRPVGGDTLADLFAAQAARTPDAPAVTFEGAALTYRELDERSNLLARKLIVEGVGPESTVAVALRRSPELVVAIYAVVKAGGAYLPIDPDHPAARTRYVIDTAAPRCVIGASGVPLPEMPVPVLFVDGQGSDDPADAAPITDRDRRAPLRPAHPAYLLFTSGSTGRPKGVAVSHAAIVNRLRWMQSEYPLGADDTVLHKTPVTFDVSVWELFWPLQVGARMVLARPAGHGDPRYLAELIERESVTTAHFVPSMLAVFVAELGSAGARCASLRQVFASGESLPAQTAARLREVAPATALHNLYGPTEAAVDVTFHEVTEADAVAVPIGGPVWNTQVLVLDARLHPAPVGGRGELYLAGEQLARGYVGRPELTADRFVAHPYAVGGRMYRTGDLVRWVDSEGSLELEYLGRTDFQVKLRGQRIELGEIEAALLRRPEIEQAVALVRGDRLAAYVVAARDDVEDEGAAAGLDTAGLGRALGDELPAYMVPSVIAVLPALPVGVNGKLDRAALPAVDSAPRVHRAPRTDTETTVAAVFADLTGAERVGADDDFFALGGNSLSATQAVARLGDALDATVPLRLVFEAPTVAALAAKLAELAGSGRRAPLVAGPRPQHLPLSPAQQRLWFLNRFDPQSAAYNLPFAVRLTGDLDVDALAAAVTDVLARHESLRTSYPDDGAGPRQLVHAAEPVDLTPVPTTEEALIGEIGALVLAGFDLTAQIPLRARLFALGADTYVLAIAVHHIAADGFSARPLARDLAVAYAARVGGAAPQWSPLPVQYADYALWCREALGDPSDPDSVAAGQLRHWTGQLSGLADELQLPADRRRPASPSYGGATVHFRIDAALHDRMRAVAREHGVSLFMVAHAALAALLHRMASVEDVVVGTAIAGRGEQVLDELIGMFVNTLVLRSRIRPGMSFTDLLDHVRGVDLDAFAHADVPFEQVVDAMRPARMPGRHPLFQVALAVEQAAAGGMAVELPGVRVAAEQIDAPVAKFDLQFTLVEKPGNPGNPENTAGIDASIGYATDLFDESTVTALAERFVRLLSGALTEPDSAVGDLEIRDERERAELTALSGPEAPPVVTLPQILARAAARPDAIALSGPGFEMSYGELDRASTRLARELIARGAGPETVVALATARSAESVLAVWAVAKTGAPFVPVDPRHPADRIAYLLGDSAVRLGVTTAAVRADLSDATVDSPVDWLVLDDDTVAASVAGRDDAPITDADRTAPVHADHPAYLIYTSGSTGKPKGVAVTHRGLASLVCEQRERLRTDAAARVLHAASPSFDASVFELLLAFGSGATAVPSPADMIGGPELTELLRTQRVTHAVLTPSVLGSLDESGLGELRVVMIAGEACPPELVSRWATGRTVVNGYGPTEATVWATGTELHPGEPVRIGRPVRGLRVAVLDSRLRPVPAGVVGELYLSGAALARGYHGRPALTADRFVADPRGAGARMYRTGDLVRWVEMPDGHTLDYVGRNDFQVKIRGLRIEIGEIDAALAAHPSVQLALTLGLPAPNGDTVLVSYVHGDGEVDADAVAAFAAGRLPAYMRPAHLIVLDEVPLTPVGKLDRNALPRPDFGGAREYREPVAAEEIAVAAAFAEISGAARVGLDDGFFELGGNSLTATQAVARIAERTGRAIAVRDLFDAPTVAALAAVVARAAALADRPPLVPQPRPDAIPLSYAQQRMWLINRIDPASAMYNLPMVLRLTGDLDVAALGAALADLLGRHEALRTVYPEGSEGAHQVIVPVPQGQSVLAAIPVDPAALERELLAFAGAGFDLTSDLPVRLRLFALGPDEYVLALVTHHIAADGWSLAPLARDLMTAYLARRAGLAPVWPALPVQYADFALWQRQLLGGEDDPESLLSRQIGYWKRTLAGAPEALALPGTRPRPAQRTGRGGRIAFEIPASVHAGAARLAGEAGASVFMVVHAALSALLSRLSGTSDIVVGTPVAGRGDRALDDLVGMLVGTVVLRTVVEQGQSFADLLGAVRRADLDAFSHADVPFEKLVEVLAPPRSTAHHPLFQVMLGFQNLDTPELDLPGLAVAGVELDTPLARFDLDMALSERRAASGAPDGIDGRLTYAADLFDESEARALVDRYLRLLAAVVAEGGADRAVGDVDLLGGGEGSVLDVAGAGEVVALSGAPSTLVDVFEAQVARTPQAPAVWSEAGELTYADLDASSNSLACRLIDAGVGPEDVVALALPRSLELVVAAYAVLKAGAAYLPLDPEHPAERTAQVLASASPRVVIGDCAAAAAVGIVVLDPAGDRSATDPATDTERLRRPLRPQHPAYVIYTSGSTGVPKGVTVTHEAIVNRLAWMQAQFPLSAADSVVQKTPATFDVSVWELFWPLQVGARLVLARPDGHRDPAYLARLLVQQRVSVAHFVPSMLAVFLADRHAADAGERLRFLFASGEALPAPVAERARTVLPHTVLHNLYGPTEAAVDVTHHAVTAADATSVPIGRPVWNTGVAVLDARLRPVPVGVPGELYLSGVQLARGYLGRPALTADRFVADPSGGPGERMYRTGDLARWVGDGSGVPELEYLGRTDFQVKLRGQRLELGEVEAALSAVDGVEQAVALVRDDGPGPELVGYVVGKAVVAAAAGAIAPESVIARVRQALPGYMVPSAVVVLGALPTTANGKLDRAALPAPQRAGREYVPPRTELERGLAGAFAEVLGVERVGRDDNFFDLGGNSLLATTLVAAAREALGVELPLQWLFLDPTPASIATRLGSGASGVAGGDDALAVLLRIRGGSGAPVFCVHPITGLAWCYGGLAQYVGGDRPIYGLQSPALTEPDGAQLSLSDLADRYVREIRSVQPHGPYDLLGWSLGGVIAHAVATRLQAAGESVGSLALLDSGFGDLTDHAGTAPSTDDLLGGLGLDIPDGGVGSAATGSDLPTPADLDPEQVAALLAGMPEPLGSLSADAVLRLLAAADASATQLAVHRPARFDGDLLFFSAAEGGPAGDALVDLWRPFVSGTITDHRVPSTHWRMASARSLETIGPLLENMLDSTTKGAK